MNTIYEESIQVKDSEPGAIALQSGPIFRKLGSLLVGGSTLKPDLTIEALCLPSKSRPASAESASSLRHF